MEKVTRIAYSKNLNRSKYERLTEIASRLGNLRKEVWHRFGSVSGVSLGHRDIRDQWLKERRKFDVPARLWKETLRDVMADIEMYREASKAKVRKAIHHRETDVERRKQKYILLRQDRWSEDGYVRRMMRKLFRHGQTDVENQIILDTDCYTTFEYGGQTWIAVMSLEDGHRIAIPLNTNVCPTGTIRLILRNGRVEFHYAVDEIINSTKKCGTKEIGIDKGYTEAFVDSDDVAHGEKLGELLTAESDYLKTKYQRRNRLALIAEMSPKKAENILKNNMGRKKLDARQHIHTENIRDKIFKAVHSIVDKAKTIVCEDLTKHIPDKKEWGKNWSRRMSGWVKGIMQTALISVSRRRGSSLVPVNCAYTSQMDSRHDVLLGRREGKKFYCYDGVVLDANGNAARNVFARKDDTEIRLWTSYKQVKSILQSRTEIFKQRMGLLIQDSSCKMSTESELPLDNFEYV